MWASLQRLRAAGLDPRELTSVVVDLDVDTRAGPAPLVLNRVYSSDPSSKLAAVASLLGDSKVGFAITPPVLPRALLVADAQPNVRASWSAPQQAWYQELVSQSRDYGFLVREPGNTLEQRETALTALFKLVNIGKVRELWPQQELTSSWADLLLPPSAILQDRARVMSRWVSATTELRVPEHTYRMRLCCPTAEVTYIAAGCIANYALLPREVPEVAQRLRTILNSGDPRSPESAETSASEASSSDSDGEWQTYRSSRAAAQQRRRTASRAKQLAAFVAKELAASRFQADSTRPLLQLVSRVTMRSWQQRFVECFVSNWQSVGCRDHFGEDDPAFVRVTTAVSELQDPAAVRWHLRDQVGGTLVSLFVRDDLFPLLPKLNTALRQSPELQHAALRVVCEAHPRRARGQRFAPNDKRRYVLTPEDAPSSRRSLAPASGSHPPSPSALLGGSSAALPSWAAVLSAARAVNPPTVRRPSTAPSLDHRPHKEQRREAQPALRSAPAPVGNPVGNPARASQAGSSPAPWEARLAALEARLNGIQALCDSLRDVPRMLASIQQKLDLQMSTPPPHSPPSAASQLISPTSAASARSAPGARPPHDSLPSPAAMAGTTGAEFLERLDAQESMLGRLMTHIEYLTRSAQVVHHPDGGQVAPEVTQLLQLASAGSHASSRS